MQTFVHAGIGLVLGQVFSPRDLKPQAIIVGASVMPDVPTFVLYVCDILKRRPIFSRPSKKFLLIQNIVHSLVVWAVIGAFSLFAPILLRLFIGGFFHVFVDVPTHKSEKYRDREPTWIWPLPWSLYGFAFCDYRDWAYEKRQGIGKVLPSLIELAVIAFCLILRFFL